MKNFSFLPELGKLSLASAQRKQSRSSNFESILLLLLVNPRARVLLSRAETSIPITRNPLDKE